MDSLRNPFVPGAGTPPPALAGREKLLAASSLALQRVRLGRPAKSVIAVGLRGVGKTVILNQIRQDADAEGYRLMVAEAHEQKTLAALLVPLIRRQLLELDRLGALNETVKRGLRVLKSFMTGLKLKLGDVELALDIDPELGAADSGDIEADLPELFVSLAKAAQARSTAIALIIDEIQYLVPRDFSALIMALHQCAQQNLPIVMMAAGLPQTVGNAGRSKSYAERMFSFPPIGALSSAESAHALQGPAQDENTAFEDDALQRIIALSQGYPYFLQEFAYHAWEAAPGPKITLHDVETGQVRAQEQLDQSFFRVRFDRLTPREKDYLRAMADCGAGPYRSGDVAAKLGIAVSGAAPLRGGLIGKGMIYSPSHGDTDFTVPMFDQFMRRIMPQWPDYS